MSQRAAVRAPAFGSRPLERLAEDPRGRLFADNDNHNNDKKKTNNNNNDNNNNNATTTTNNNDIATTTTTTTTTNNNCLKYQYCLKSRIRRSRTPLFFTHIPVH